MSTGEASTSDVLETLQHKGDNFARLIILERKKLNDLVDAIRHIDDQIEKYRAAAKQAAIDVMNKNMEKPVFKKADGAQVGQQAIAVTTKVMAVLEAKVNAYLQRKSEKQKNNNKLKLEIDHMRRMRLQTDLSHKNFDSSLKALREKIAFIMNDSTAVVEHRESLVDAIHTMERQNAEEQAKFEIEFDEMGKYIQEQNTNLENALLQERKENLKDDVDKQNARASKDSSNLEEDIRIAGRVGELNGFVASETSSSESVKNAISKYERMFEQLKKITCSDNLQAIASSYSSMEEEMFSLIKYLQDQNAQIEHELELQKKIKMEVDEYTAQQAVEDEDRMRFLKKLQKRLEITKQSAVKCEEATKLNQEATHEVAKKIQNLFFKLQCDQMDNPNKQTSTGGNVGGKGGNSKSSSNSTTRGDTKLSLLTSQGVTESNVLDYLGVIEQRAVDIITEYIKVQSSTLDQTRSPTPGPNSPFRWPMDPFVSPPELHEDALIGGGDDENEGKPVDLKTFKEKLVRRVHTMSASQGHYTSSIGLK